MKEQLIPGQLVGELIYIKDTNCGTALRKCEFRCLCGKIIIVRLADVKRGKCRSCGCRTGELISKKRSTHGQSKVGNVTPEYRRWHSMKARCYNKNLPRYIDWGGRGITVCEEWKNSFEKFYEDMGPLPFKRAEIDRINNDGNYCKKNCRWATRSEQNNNKRSNIVIDYKGRTQTLAEWCKELKLSYSAILTRIQRDGHSIEQAFETPIARNHMVPLKVKQLTMKGEFIKKWNTVKEAAEYHKVDRTCISECAAGKQKHSRGYKWEYVYD